MRRTLLTLLGLVLIATLLWGGLSLLPTWEAGATPNEPLPPRPTVAAPGSASPDPVPDSLLSVDRAAVNPGDLVTLSLAVENNEKRKIQGVEVRVPTIEGLEIQSVDASRGKRSYNAGNNTWKVWVGGLKPGTGTQLTIIARAKAGPDGPRRIYAILPVFYKGGYKLSNMQMIEVK